MSILFILMKYFLKKICSGWFSNNIYMMNIFLFNNTFLAQLFLLQKMAMFPIMKRRIMIEKECVHKMTNHELEIVALWNKWTTILSHTLDNAGH